MMNKVLLAVALLSAAILPGCATGGGGHTGHNIFVTVDTNPSSQHFTGVTLTVQFVASVTGTDEKTVTWSLSGTGCSGAACGTINATTGLYTTPNSVPADGLPIAVTATLVSNTSKTDTYTMTVEPITVLVTPKLSNGDP